MRITRVETVASTNALEFYLTLRAEAEKKREELRAVEAKLRTIAANLEESLVKGIGEEYPPNSEEDDETYIVGQHVVTLHAHDRRPALSVSEIENGEEIKEKNEEQKRQEEAYAKGEIEAP